LRPRVRVYAREDLQRLRDPFERLGQPYPDPDLPGVWRVPVMSFRTTLCEALIDAEDVPRVTGLRWNWMERGDGYDPAVVLADPAAPHTPMRQIILGLDTAHWRVVHGNRDPLDCRRANLIVRNLSEQAASSRKAATHCGEPCTSRFKGVTWEQSRGKWRATIAKGDLTRFLGRFRDEIAAAQAHDEAARELFGEHARLNFPDGVDAFLAAETAKAAEGGDDREAA
jgi:hypothetical protein